MTDDKWLDEVYGKTNSELYDNWVNYNEQVIEELGWKCHTLASEWIINNFKTGTEVADIGCGNGQVGFAINQGLYLIDGYDINQPMLDRFIAKNYRSTQIHDITKAPLPKKYKCITAIGVLTVGHVDAGSSKNLADSLTDDGLLYCSMAKHNGDWYFDGGWSSQKDLEVVRIEPIHSLTTPTGHKQYHNMITFKKAMSA
jgi:predicted TPR repeat methyltransferase